MDGNLDDDAVGLNATRDAAVQVDTLNCALAAAGVGVWEVWLPYRKYSFSESYYRMLGLGPGVGSEEPDFWGRCTHPEDLGRVQKRLHDYAAGRAPKFEVEYRLRHADGTWLWVPPRAETPCVRLTAAPAGSRASALIFSFATVPKSLCCRRSRGWRAWSAPRRHRSCYSDTMDAVCSPTSPGLVDR
jgi:PAS domain-containing protein